MRLSASLETHAARINAADGETAEVRLYERLFIETHTETGGKDFIENMNPNSLKTVTA